MDNSEIAGRNCQHLPGFTNNDPDIARIEAGQLTSERKPDPAPRPALAPLSGRVLVAEDDESMRDLIEFYLHDLGLECRLVGDGVDAVDAALAGKFDILLMDMEMPVMDGFEATHALRESGYQAPIIALTAHRDNLEIERARRAGCNDVLNKPVTIEKLRETIAPLLGGQGSSRSTAAPGLDEQEAGNER